MFLKIIFHKFWSFKFIRMRVATGKKNLKFIEFLVQKFISSNFYLFSSSVRSCVKSFQSSFDCGKKFNKNDIIQDIIGWFTTKLFRYIQRYFMRLLSIIQEFQFTRFSMIYEWALVDNLRKLPIREHHSTTQSSKFLSRMPQTILVRDQKLTWAQ